MAGRQGDGDRNVRDDRALHLQSARSSLRRITQPHVLNLPSRCQCWAAASTDDGQDKSDISSITNDGLRIVHTDPRRLGYQPLCVSW